MANRNWASGGKIYSMHTMPILLDCNFIVDATQGAGISSLKGPAISAVYMHSSSPSAANPNPEAGIIMVKLADRYNRFFSQFASIAAPAGTPAASVTANVTHTITALGTATLAQWQAKGLPVGTVPAVGVAFIASATGTIGGAATAAPVAQSNVLQVQLVGNPNLTVIASASANGYIMFQCLDAAGALVAPTAGSLISLAMYLSNSSVQIQGE